MTSVPSKARAEPRPREVQGDDGNQGDGYTARSTKKASPLPDGEYRIYEASTKNDVVAIAESDKKQLFQVAVRGATHDENRPVATSLVERVSCRNSMDEGFRFKHHLVEALKQRVAHRRMTSWLSTESTSTREREAQNSSSTQPTSTPPLELTTRDELDGFEQRKRRNTGASCDTW
eukprot:TRINITY_DN111523_c0_g1_i1.p1 TRINITY_DN111523_c0_g1~~TRINITY_DN111523_c0_g1_i1.p1  ORF type:complete len:176 (-),score=21.63 TRINITY_DN111523_c0_g1_i1:7-534(-)